MSRSVGYTYSSIIQPSASRMSAISGTEWEDLRKQARQHENEIDSKLISLSKLRSNYSAATTHDPNDTSTTCTSSSFEMMSVEIEQLLERLSDINKRMSDVVPELLGPNSAATHTLKRHYEILQDYCREFDRMKATVPYLKNRENLSINSNTNNSDSAITCDMSSRRQDYYFREMNYLNNSDSLMNTNIEVASIVKNDLSDQRKYLLNITNKVNTIANRSPLVNNLLQKIKVKKRKDSLVLGCVIGFCLIFLLLYRFR